MFEGLSAAKNCLRPESAPLNKVLYDWYSNGTKEKIKFSVKFSQSYQHKEVAMKINRPLSLQVEDWH